MTYTKPVRCKQCGNIVTDDPRLVPELCLYCGADTEGFDVYYQPRGMADPNFNDQGGAGPGDVYPTKGPRFWIIFYAATIGTVALLGLAIYLLFEYSN